MKGFPRILWLLGTLAGCAGAWADGSAGAFIPVPSFARSSVLDVLADGRTQLRFTVEDSFPTSRSRDFYEQWALLNGWKRVSLIEEPLSSDRSEPSRDEYNESIRQRLLHWKSPDGRESLRPD